MRPQVPGLLSTTLAQHLLGQNDMQNSYDIEWVEYYDKDQGTRLLARHLPDDMTLAQAVEAWREANADRPLEYAMQLLR